VGYTAKVLGVAKLYHYQPYNAEHLRDLLSENRIYCSRPANLNDPWDCQPWFHEDSLNDPAKLDEFLKFANSRLAPGQKMSKKQIAAARKCFEENPELLRETLNKSAANAFQNIPQTWRISCLTPDPRSILMWSHYAQNHHGICLEFSTANPLFGSAEAVEYESAYPRWTPQSCVEGADNRRVFLTKSDAWKYEQEFRIIAFDEKIDDEYKAHPLAVRDGFLKLPPKALMAIIVGCNGSHEVVEAMIRKYSDVKVKQMVRARAEYRLEVSD
jgi:hypothetical protein